MVYLCVHISGVYVVCMWYVWCGGCDVGVVWVWCVALATYRKSQFHCFACYWAVVMVSVELVVVVVVQMWHLKVK